MPGNPLDPGVYIEEVPSGNRTIIGVPTSITAFIGRAQKGPTNEPTHIQSYGEFQRTFGGLWTESTLSYAVLHYFQNGGRDALIVRVHNGATRATTSLPAGIENLHLIATSEGIWGNNLQVTVDHTSEDPTNLNTFDLTIGEVAEIGNSTNPEIFRNLVLDDQDARYAKRVLAAESNLAQIYALPSTRPDPQPNSIRFSGGSDGNDLTASEYKGSKSSKTGLYALENADIFNILCMPPMVRSKDIDPSTWREALEYCNERRAFLIIDPPLSWNDPADITSNTTGLDSLNLRDKNAAIYFPRVRIADALDDNRLQTFGPCGVVAGVIARTDSNRGVWKAPAGIEATLLGVSELAYHLTDSENKQLNTLGVNCLRNFPVIGNVVWGSRTLEGADRLASEWKYIPVRRLALFIEESLFRGTQWVVFEPNGEPLWVKIRTTIGAFMHTLYRQGAFQGASPRDAYIVKCDSETTTQNDLNQGIVNVIVGFAPLKPSEFVIIRLQQMAGQIEV